MNADLAALPSRPSPGAAGARLGELYAEHARMVLGICRLMLRDPSEAEDATQQVFLSAYRSLLSGTEVEKAGAWLGTIARNESLMRIQARMRTPLPTDEAVTLVSPGAEEQAESRAEATELYTELAALPVKQREAVVLRDLYGLRYDEVAIALGTSRPAVEALLFRGRRRLKRRLRPSLAAGVLVVPLALHESLAYAVPGFGAAAGSGATVGVAAAAPLLVKLAAGGAAAVLAGSAGVAVEGTIRDRPDRPSQASGPAPARRAAVRAAQLPPLAATQAQQFGDVVGPELAAAAGKVARANESDDDHTQRESRGKESQADDADGPAEDADGRDRSGSGSDVQEADAGEAEQEQPEPETVEQFEGGELYDSTAGASDSGSSGSESSDSNDEDDSSGED